MHHTILKEILPFMSVEQNTAFDSAVDVWVRRILTWDMIQLWVCLVVI